MRNRDKEDFIAILNISTYEDVTTFDAEIETFIGTITIPKLKVVCDLGKGIPCEGHLGYRLIYPESIKLNKRYEVNLVNKLIHSGYVKHPLEGHVESNLEWRTPGYKTEPKDRMRSVYKFRDYKEVRGRKDFFEFVRGLGYELSDSQITNLLRGRISGPIRNKYPDLSPDDFQIISHGDNIGNRKNK